MQTLPFSSESPDEADDLATLLRLREDEEDRLYAPSSLYSTDPNAELGIGDANVFLYARAAYWAPFEIAALSIGKNPNVMMQPDSLQARRLGKYLTCKLFAERIALVSRAVDAGQLFEKTTPAFAVAWMQRMQIPCPPLLGEVLQNLGMQIADWKSEHDRRVAEIRELESTLSEAVGVHAFNVQFLQERLAEKEDWQESALEVLKEQEDLIAANADYANALEADLTEAEAEIEELRAAQGAVDQDTPSARERNNMLKIIHAMAVKGYSYDPAAQKSKIPGEIESDMNLLGLDLSAASIRKYLKEAAQKFGEAQGE